MVNLSITFDELRFVVFVCRLRTIARKEHLADVSSSLHTRELRINYSVYIGSGIESNLDQEGLHLKTPDIKLFFIE